MGNVPPTHKRKRAKTAKKREVESATKQARVLELRAAGFSFREIGAHVGCSHVEAQRRFYSALRELTQPDADEARTASMTRITAMRKMIWDRWLVPHKLKPGEKCAACGHVEGDGLLAATGTLVKLEEREAKLTGLDAPQRIDIQLGAPKPFPVDARSRTEAVERLTVDEQRTLLHLIRKMRGEPPHPLPPLAPPPITNGHANGHDHGPDAAARRLADDLLSGRAQVKDDDDEID